jgi:hypothetical protein
VPEERLAYEVQREPVAQRVCGELPEHEALPGFVGRQEPEAPPGLVGLRVLGAQPALGGPPA